MLSISSQNVGEKNQNFIKIIKETIVADDFEVTIKILDRPPQKTEVDTSNKQSKC